MTAPEPGGYELQRALEAQAVVMREGFAGLNARLDKLVSADAFLGERGRVDDRLKDLADDIGPEPARQQRRHRRQHRSHPRSSRLRWHRVPHGPRPELTWPRIFSKQKNLQDTPRKGDAMSQNQEEVDTVLQDLMDEQIAAENQQIENAVRKHLQQRVVTTGVQLRQAQATIASLEAAVVDLNEELENLKKLPKQPADRKPRKPVARKSTAAPVEK